MRTTISYFTILLAIILCIFSYSCRSNPDIAPPSKKTPAVIQNVQTGKVINGKYIATSSFNIGDQANMRITAIEKDIDIHTIHIRAYYPKDAENPQLEYQFSKLEPQPKESISFFLKTPLTISGPPGEWRVDIQIEDESQNYSNLYHCCPK